MIIIISYFAIALVFGLFFITYAVKNNLEFDYQTAMMCILWPIFLLIFLFWNILDFKERKGKKGGK